MGDTVLELLTMCVGHATLGSVNVSRNGVGAEVKRDVAQLTKAFAQRARACD